IGSLWILWVDVGKAEKGGPADQAAGSGSSGDGESAGPANGIRKDGGHGSQPHSPLSLRKPSIHCFEIGNTPVSDAFPVLWNLGGATPVEFRSIQVNIAIPSFAFCGATSQSTRPATCRPAIPHLIAVLRAQNRAIRLFAQWTGRIPAPIITAAIAKQHAPRLAVC